MRDIICPHCAKAFKIDESGYADIVKQVRDSEFNEQLHERLALAEQGKQNAVEPPHNAFGRHLWQMCCATVPQKIFRPRATPCLPNLLQLSATAHHFLNEIQCA